MTTPPILVTGGTGTLGQQVVQRLRQAGRDVRVLAQRTAGGPLFLTGDLATGAGLSAAAHGVGTIVHCASSQEGGRRPPRGTWCRPSSQVKTETGLRRTWCSSPSSVSTVSRAVTTSPSWKRKA